MNTDMYTDQEKQPDRKQYQAPVLEDLGALNELTHGSTGPNTDGGGEPYAFPQG